MLPYKQDIALKGHRDTMLLFFINLKYELC
nr:MAG TPA: hypothetical protein [Crassvirales sp.]